MEIIKKYRIFLENRLTMDDDGPIDRKESEFVYDVIRTIERDCKPFLEDLKKANIKGSEAMKRVKELGIFSTRLGGHLFETFGFLWRGVGEINSSNILFEKPPHLMVIEETIKDRYPKDTSDEVHFLLDDEFNKQFNIRPRSQGVFTTPKYHTAKGYGNTATPFLVFPIGDYEFIWSKEISDLYSEIEDEYWYKTISWDNIPTNIDLPTAEEEIPILVGYYQMNDLRSALLSGHEISIMCDKYYLVSPHKEIIRKFYNR